MLRTDPAVFAVGKNYQIIITSKTQSFISVRIGDKVFVDDANGILKSASRTHRIIVSQDILNKERKYTVQEMCIIKRLPYFTKTRKEKYFDYEFRPVEGDNIRCYHIADAHNEVRQTVDAAKAYGDIDFLILNGDIPEDSGRTQNFDTIFDIVSGVTHGNIPAVFSRGNHDLRGNCAEKFAEFTPAENGNTFYSFRLGNIWGLCLDCGEDKGDWHAEYGHSVACHQFREKETEYIKKIIKENKMEYNAPDVKHKLIICHVPFTHRFQAPFDIEPEIYSEWSKLLRENIHPELMICGHTHKLGIYEPGCEYDTYGQPCTVVVASETEKHKFFIGTGFEFTDNNTKITFTHNDGSVIDEVVL